MFFTTISGVDTSADPWPLASRYVERINQTANLDPEEHPPDKHWKDDDSAAQ